MKKVAFLSMDSLEGFSCYDHLLYEPLNKLGWKAQQVSWKSKDIDWNDYDSVIVRSTWDYQDEPEKFLKVLEQINDSKAVLLNDIEVMKWNMNKNYLFDLAKKGVSIPPTLLLDEYDYNKISKSFNEFQCDEIVIKPLISASAFNTFRIRKNNLNDYNDNLQSTFRNRSFLIQPFLTSIIDEGEYSLFYFGGKYSHTILKTPKTEDFRVQEEHGGILKLVEPEKQMKSVAENSLKFIPKLLYARIDLARTEKDNFVLMELELIEPSLYFNMAPESAAFFAQVFHERMISE